MDFATVKPALKAYLERLKQHNIDVSRALIFGSLAEGQAQDDSDIDLLIVSSDFAPLDDEARLKLLYRASVGFPYDLHVYGVTPQEFASASPLTTLGALHSSTTIEMDELGTAMGE